MFFWSDLAVLNDCSPQQQVRILFSSRAIWMCSTTTGLV